MFTRWATTNNPWINATGELMAEESNCQYVASLPSAIPQLVLMGLIDNELVVEPACKVIGAFPCISHQCADSRSQPSIQIQLAAGSGMQRERQ